MACCNDNATNPNAPEYQKPWKPENNSGCGCNASPSTISCTSGIEGEIIVVSNLTRSDIIIQ